MRSFIEKHRLFQWIPGILILLLGGGGIALAEGPVVDGAVKPDKSAAVERPVPRSLGAAKFFDQTNLVKTPRLNVEDLLEEDAAQTQLGPSRIGVTQEFPPVSTKQGGKWTTLPDGGHLWTAWFRAPGAISMRLRITPWRLPPGAEVLIYAADGEEQIRRLEAAGAGRKGDEFWTPPVFSDEVRLEYYLPENIDPTAEATVFSVDAISNQYRPIPGTAPQEGSHPVVLNCHLDVSCYADWQNQADGVGALTYISSPAEGQFFCSGCMYNRVPGDFTPLFATARHCGGNDGWSQAEAESAIVFWFYQTPSCNGTPPNPATLPSTSGVVLLVDDPNTDYTLLGLESDVPGGVEYEGWDAGYWADGEAATGIHHPRGTHKRITFGTKTDDITSCIPAQAWQVYVADGDGELEPGSSGSPVFDDSHRVRGTASCATWSCTSDDYIDYGRLDTAFTLLEPYIYRNDAAEWDAYVNGSYTGTEKGTVSQPFDTVVEGIFAVRGGTAYSVYIEAGNYNERLVIDKPMILKARNGVVTIGQ
jgi:lysyl endopeptidase